MCVYEAEQAAHSTHEAQVEIVPLVELSQVHQLLEELDDFFIGWRAAGSHRGCLFRLLARLAVKGAPGFELLDELAKPVSVVEGVRLHGFFKPKAVLLRHHLELGRLSAILVLH